MSYTQRIIDPYGYGAAMLARQKSQEAGMPLSFYSGGRQYTLKPDLQMQARLEAGEKEAARRSGRKEQKILPTFRYVDPSGKRFEGTWMGGGSYGGFGGGGPQSSQRSWDNYVERVGPRNPDYGSNPEKIAKAMAQKEMEEEDVMGYAGSPMAFTPFGEKIGIKPTAIVRSPFEGQDIRGLTGFGGIPAFPYANY